MSDSLKTRWLRIGAIIPSSALAFMDQSILPVALPVIGEEWNIQGGSLQWTVNAYLLAMAVFILIGGKWGDRVGHRRAYLWGIALFALSSALCGLSPNLPCLIAARALQGLGAALIFPAQTSLIATSFPPAFRGQATGIIISIGSTFLILGPVIGGFLTEALSWHWIFWINLPIAALGILLTLAILPATPGHPEKTDLWGFLYFGIFATLLTLFFMQGPDWGWRSGPIALCALFCLVSLILLFRREKMAKHPFLQLALFKRPLFAAINVSIAITQFILMITVFRTIYTEEILGYTPFQAGLILSVSASPVLFFSYIAGFLADKISPKLPIVLGYLSLIFSFFWFGWIPTPSLTSYFVASLLFGMGIPLIFTPSYSMAMSAIPREQLGGAFGMIATVRMFAGTIGLALIFVFVNAEQARRLPRGGERLAEIGSFSAVHFLLGTLLIVAFLTAFFFQRRKSVHHPPDSPAEGWD